MCNYILKRSSNLLDGEEVFALELSILGQVGAVDRVLDSVCAEASSQCVWSQVLCNLWVHWAAQVTERLDCVLLADLHGNARARSHLLSQLSELWQHTLVNLEELLSSWSIEVEHLHSANLEALLKDCVNNLSSEASLNCMWLDHSARAVREHSRGWELSAEEHVHLSLLLLEVIGTVNGILHSIGSVRSPKGRWCVHLCLNRVSWSNKLVPLGQGTISDNLNSSADITLQESALIAVLVAEELASRGSTKARHLHLGNNETVSVDRIDDLSSVHVDVGLDHGKLGLLATGERLSGESVTIVCNLELTSVDSDNASNVELVFVHVTVRLPLQEHPSVLQVVL